MIKMPIFLLWEREVSCGRIGDWKIIGYTKYEEHATAWLGSSGKISRRTEEVNPICSGALERVLRAS